MEIASAVEPATEDIRNLIGYGVCTINGCDVSSLNIDHDIIKISITDGNIITNTNFPGGAPSGGSIISGQQKLDTIFILILGHF